MRKEARTVLDREMAQRRLNFLLENPDTKGWMFEQSDRLWTVAWVVADPGSEPATAAAALGLDITGVEPAPDAAAAALGSLSARYESNGRPDAIGVDKNGGWSYGAYQIATRTGTMDTFLEYLKAQVPAMHLALMAAGGPVAALQGSDDFKDAWIGLARNPGFGQAQHDFIRVSHYQPFVRKLKADLGLDAEARSAALRDVLWSVAVQHGAANTIVHAALAGRQASALGDKTLILAIYAERSKVDLYFPSSTPQVRLAVANRFAGEQAQALTMLA